MKAKQQDYLTVDEFAERIGVSRPTAIKIIEAGEVVVEDRRSPGSPRSHYHIPAGQVDEWRRARQKRLTRPKGKSGSARSARGRRSHVAEVVR